MKKQGKTAAQGSHWPQGSMLKEKQKLHSCILSWGKEPLKKLVACTKGHFLKFKSCWQKTLLTTLIYYFQDKNLKRSVTSPGSVSDWMTSGHMAAGADTVEKKNVQMENHYPRQRTWSARTFHDFLAPIPQLQKKWCSWTTNSPFTKLVDNSVSLARRRAWGGQLQCPYFAPLICRYNAHLAHLAQCTGNSFA